MRWKKFGSTFCLGMVVGVLFAAPTFLQAQTTWYVDVNCPYPPGAGTEDDPFCKIQQGIQAALNGDTVLVADGVYTGLGNQDIIFPNKAIIVQSQSEDAAACIIDCGGSGRAFYFYSLTEEPEIGYFTIRNGSVDYGGAIYCSDASPKITGCVISGNKALYDGGGIYNPIGMTIIGCTISGNWAGDRGGGLFGGGEVKDNILWGNCADSGVDWYANGIGCANLEDDECLGYCNCLGSSVDGLGDVVCNCLKGPEGSKGSRFFADPLFCDPEPCANAPTAEGNYYLRPGSPCSDPGGPCTGHGQIGALGVDCVGCCVPPDFQCTNTNLNDCLEMDGTPQGTGDFCTGLWACCRDGGTDCIDVDRVCCDEAGGDFVGSVDHCLGDNDVPPNGIDDACEQPPPVPTVSEWGLIIITLLLLTAGTVVFGRRRSSARTA